MCTQFAGLSAMNKKELQLYRIACLEHEGKRDGQLSVSNDSLPTLEPPQK